MQNPQLPHRIFLLCSFLLCYLTTQAQLVRQPNTTLNFPQEPVTVSSFVFEDTFPGISFRQPVAVTHPPSETDRLFVVEKVGRVQVINNISSSPSRSVFLNIESLVRNHGECGLLGFAFHPNYSVNGFFYVFYCSNEGNNRVSRFSVMSGNPNIGDPTSEVILIDQVDQSGNHNAGDMHFGPDGYLYIALGDEGDANDARENSQRITKDFFSALLRIDVDRLPGNLEPNPHPSVVNHGGTAAYKVPADNPFVGATSFNGQSINPADVRTEFWAVGFRNPFRFSIDAPTERVFLGDVGQDEREEVNLVTRGGNYGWVYREGTIANPTIALTPPPGFTHIDPIFDYNHEGGGSFSIIGGVICRSPQLPQLAGKYLCADFYDGRVWALTETSLDNWSEEVIATEASITSFGVNPSTGDVLVTTHNGRLKKLVANFSSGSQFPATLTATGAFSDVASMTPHTGIVAYEPNVSLWSDYALKQRWFSIPDASNDIVYSRDENWTFPAGMVWIKHFDLEMERGNPSSARRLETRFLVKTEEDFYGLTYRWNTSQTEATLVDPDGMDEDFTIDVGGGTTITQTWRYPSHSECIQCHTDVGGVGLSFNTRQLNRDYTHGPVTQNQIEALSAAGYFTEAVSEPSSSLPYLSELDEVGESIEHRARSYLDVNCSQCHQPGGPAITDWDARINTPLSLSGIINGSVVNSGGNPDARVIVPGSLDDSVLFDRMGESGGFSRMPPLATSLLDTDALVLFEDWIVNHLRSEVVLNLTGSTYIDSEFYFTGGLSANEWITSAISPTATLSYDISGAGLYGTADSLELKITSLNGRNLYNHAFGLSVMGGNRNGWWDVGENLLFEIALKDGTTDVTSAYDLLVSGAGLRKTLALEADITDFFTIGAGQPSGSYDVEPPVSISNNEFIARRTAGTGFSQLAQIQLEVRKSQGDPVEVVTKLGTEAHGFSGGLDAAAYADGSHASFSYVYDIAHLNVGADTLEVFVEITAGGGRLYTGGGGQGLATNGEGRRNQWDTGEDLNVTASLKLGGADVTESFEVSLTGFSIRWRDRDTDNNPDTQVTAIIAGESVTPTSSASGVHFDTYALPAGQTDGKDFSAIRTEALDTAQLSQFRFEILETD